MKPKPLRSQFNNLEKACKALNTVTAMINELNDMLPPAGSAYPEPTLPNYKRLRAGWMTTSPLASVAEKEHMFESRRLCNAIWGRRYTRKVLLLIEDRKL